MERSVLRLSIPLKEPFVTSNGVVSERELLLLRPSLLEAVGELIAALARGTVAVDAWLARFEPAQGSPASPAPSRRAAAAGRLKVTR